MIVVIYIYIYIHIHIYIYIYIYIYALRAFNYCLLLKLFSAVADVEFALKVGDLL